MAQLPRGSAHVVLVLSDHKNLEYFATTNTAHPPPSPLVGVPLWIQLLITTRAGWLGTNRMRYPLDDVYPRGENAYTLLTPITFQSMFKLVSYWRAIVLDLHHLLVSI